MASWLSFDWDYINGNMYPDIKENEAAHCSNENCWHKKSEKFNSVFVRPEYNGLSGWEQRLEETRVLFSRIDVLEVHFRDSHAHIINFLEPGDFCYHIDSHSDEVPEGSDWLQGVLCGNWVNYAKEKGVSVYRCEPQDVPSMPLKVFICLSRPYTSREFDKYLFEILLGFRVPVDFVGWG